MFRDLGSTQQQVAVIVGFFLPLLLAIPIQSHWPSELKTLFSVAAYAVAGAVTAAATGELTGKSFWQTTVQILVLGVVGYQGVWKPIKLAPAIEARTDVARQPLGADAATSSTASGSDSSSTPAMTGTTTIEQLLLAGTRLVDELTQGFYTNRTGNGTAASAVPSEETGANEPSNAARGGTTGQEKSAAAWVRAGRAG